METVLWCRRGSGESGVSPSIVTQGAHRAVEYFDHSGRWAILPSTKVDAQMQAAFSDRVCRLLRESRKRQRLTQAEVAARTEGLVSKAALANYETGHRSLRIEIFWVLARALGEVPGELLGAAEEGLSAQLGHHAPSVVIDPEIVRTSEDARLAPVRRWVELRQSVLPGGVAPGPMVLDAAAIGALAALMGLPFAECVTILQLLAVRPAGPLPNWSRP